MWKVECCSRRFRRLSLPTACIVTCLLVFISLHYFTDEDSEKTGVQAGYIKSYQGRSEKTGVQARYMESYQGRSERVEKSCQRSHEAKMEKIFYSKKYELCYCGVAKVGCTFWKQVIRYLNNDTQGTIYHHPLDIPRSLVHWQMKNTTETSFQDKEKYFSKYDRFMFVRDPFARLWSAYIDKVFLPDLWFNHMKRRYRFAPNNYCPSHVTFEESLKWAVGTPLRKMDPHWIPMHFSCDPCKFKPKFIGKQETFAEDTRFILSRHNLSWILDNRHRRHSHDDVKMLTKYNFGLIRQKHYRKCIDEKQLAYRLWKAFQINGHLSSDEKFPFVNAQMVSEEDFTNKVLTVMEQQAKSALELKKQRFLYMALAYQGVSNATLKELRKKYALDFEMFGYDPHNPDIFSRKYKQQ